MMRRGMLGMIRTKFFACFSLICIALILMFPVIAMASPDFYIKGIDPNQGSPETKVMISGGGATPNGTVVALLSGPINQTVFIGNDTMPIVIIGNLTVGWTSADTEGYWEIIFTVPRVSPGNYTVYAVDNETLTSDAIGFGVLWDMIIIPPSFKITNVSPTAGPPGTPVYISGEGASGTEISVYFDGASVANLTGYYWGGWGISFQVPDVAPRNYTITALDVASNQTDMAMFTVTPPPTIHVSPQEATIGSRIIITGEGFASGTSLYIAFEDLVFFTPIYTGRDGTFNVTVFVPVVNSGNYTIKALGGYYYTEGGPKLSANANFIVTKGLDALLNELTHARNTSDQTQSSSQTATDEASQANDAANTAKDEAAVATENAKSAEAMGSEARAYALTAMILAITTIVSSTVFFTRQSKDIKEHKQKATP